MADRAKVAGDKDVQHTKRFGNMLEKCGNYAIEKADAGIEPSRRVLNVAPKNVMEGFDKELQKFYHDFATQVDIIE